jgi:hypothetical protein
MSLTDKIQNFRTWQKENLGYFAKDVKEVGKDFKDKGIYTLLSAGMAFMPLVNTACDNGVTPEVPEQFITANVKSVNTQVVAENYNGRIENLNEVVTPYNTSGAKLIVKTSSGQPTAYDTIDNAAGDLDSTAGIIKVSVPKGIYQLDADAPDSHQQMSIIEDLNDNYVTHTDLNGTKYAIEINENDKKTYNCYVVPLSVDREKFRWIFQHNNATGTQRLETNKNTLVAVSVDPEYPIPNGEIPAQTIDNYTTIANLIIPKATRNRVRPSIVNADSLNGVQGWEVKVGDYSMPSHGEDMSGDIVLDSHLKLPYKVDRGKMLEEFIPALGARHDWEDQLSAIIENYGTDHAGLNPLGATAIWLVSSVPSGSKF